ncbi:MAG: PfkB family carbohydrate kinase [Acidobacteriota bacterium]|nr:PfkB family carbohydrate kinase [Acidobacteriota bacterium]
MGHLTEDRTPDGPRLGGAAAFAGLVAHRFGVPAAILTAVDAAFPYLEALDGITLDRIRSRNRTRFRNRYRSDGSRQQTIESRAAVIPQSEVRRAVAGLPPGSAVLYAPVADELGGTEALPRPRGPGALAGAAPQGLIRRWDAAGRVSTHWSALALGRLAGLDFLSLSETEFPEGGGLDAPLVAVTRGRHGAVLRRAGLPATEIPPVPGIEVDPTGAGDVFAAALFIGLWAGAPAEDATRLAAAAAAISVESPGTEGVPTLEEANARLSAFSA